MPRPFELCTARPWQAKSRPRQMAEMQFLMDRDNAKYAKESWKTLRQLMYNDLRNAMDSNEMVSKFGPANWGPELMTLGMLNNNLAALSTIPPYVAQPPTFPMPLVNDMAAMAPAVPLPAIPPIAPAPVVPTVVPRIAPAAPILPIPAPMPAPLPAVAGVVPPMIAPAAAAVPVSASFVNNIPMSVSPQILGFSVIAVLGPMEALAPAVSHYDVAVQRLTAVEGLAEKAAIMGGDGVVNLRMAVTTVGDVIAAGDVVKLVPIM